MTPRVGGTWGLGIWRGLDSWSARVEWKQGGWLIRRHSWQVLVDAALLPASVSCSFRGTSAKFVGLRCCCWCCCR